MKDKVIYLSSMIIILTAIAIAIVILFWLFYPYKVLEIKQNPVMVKTKAVKAGQILVYNFDYCKYNNLEARVTRIISDGLEYNSPVTTSNREVGCHNADSDFSVPTGLPAGGNYVLNITYTYKVNPLREIEVKAVTEKFTIIK